ncbi:MAG: hypothetical protein WB760_32515, partial [Xanthobacteraceae bacterium]
AGGGMSKALETALAAVSVSWRQRKGSAFVEAYSPTLKAWAIVAEGKDTPEWTGRDIAALVVNAVNGNQRNEAIITELVGALETCLECDDGKLDFSAEQEAEAALHMAGERQKTGKAKKPRLRQEDSR